MRRDLDLLGLLVLVVAFNAPQLAGGVVPINDTLYNFSNFHVFYSEWVTHGVLARWLPYEGYGVQADYEQLIALTPSNYLVGAIGWLAGVTDALALFKWAAVLEQMAFVFGVHRLARSLFASRATHWILGIAAVGTTVWYAQQWWDLRIYYLLPLVLSLVLDWVESKRPERLWLAGLAGVAWSIGNLPYLIPVWVLVLLVVVAVRVREPVALLRSLATPPAANAAAFLAFAVAAGVYVAFLAGSLDNTVLHASDRDPITGQVSAETFRTYGGRGNFVVILNSLLFGWPVHLPWGSWSDNSAYLGLLPLVGIGIAVARERSRVFLGLFAAALVLAWLSFGGFFTRVAYYLPGLAYFRHVGLVFGLVKVLLLVAAGFGLERLWSSGPPRWGGPVAAMLAVVFGVEILAALPGVVSLTPKGWILAWGSHFFVRLAVYAAAIALCRWRSSHRLGVALACALALDLASYQLAVFEKVPQLRGPERGLLAATRVREPGYEPVRRDLPADAAEAAQRIDDAAKRRAFGFATRRESKEVYAYAYQFADVDPCRSQLRLDARQRGVDRLLALERGGVAIGPVVGCETAKLRLAAAATLVDSDLEAQGALLAKLRAGDALPAVVQRLPGIEAPRDPVDLGGTVEVSRFTLGELVAEVDVRAPDGAWLLYADAWHPDWRASVNGAPVPVHEANLAFKAVRVPSGKSTVRFWFDRGPLAPAFALLGLALGAAGVAAIAAALRSSRSASPA